jgi:uncharacterized membrane protein YeaQ/YmgE (transglycosylase-associated protein family)
MDLLWYLISLFFFGLIVGALARLVVGGTGVAGCLPTALLGVVGSFVGGLLGRFLFGDQDLLAGYLLSFVGAVLFAVLLRMTGRRGPQS